MSTIAWAWTSLSSKRFDRRVLRLVGRLTAANDLDDFVDVIERNPVAFEQVRALFGLAEIVVRPPRNDVLAMRDEVLEQLLEREHLRLERDRTVRHAADRPARARAC